MVGGTGFVAKWGSVRYLNWLSPLNRKTREQYRVDARCEIPACDTQRSVVFDHCHRHGWIRATLCQLHNQRISLYEEARTVYGINIEGTPYWHILAKCRECIW